MKYIAKVLEAFLVAAVGFGLIVVIAIIGFAIGGFLVGAR